MLVYYPFGGTKKVLRYKTHNEGAQLILADSDEKIKSIAISALNKYENELSSFKFLNCFDIEFVSPPNWFIEKYEKFKKEEEIKSFLQTVCYEIYECVKNGMNLPSQFQLCYLEQDGEYHWNCEDEFGNNICYAGIKTISSQEEFYNKYYENWIKKFPEKKYVDPKLKISQAIQAKENDEIWMASTNFGHHCPGVEFKQLDMKNPFFKNVLFYFKKINELSLNDFDKMRDDFEKNIENKKLEKSKAFKERKQLEEKRKIDLILSVFE
jgi:hypothetical protein